jgi:GNAT superfamily N-acetyltransferase
MHNVEKADIKDALFIAELHKIGIPTGFISSLNINVVRKLYEKIIEEGIVYVLKDEKGKIIGFISCVLDTKHFYKKFIFKNFWIVLPFFLPKVFSLSFLKKVFETLTAPSKTESKKELEVPELLSIVISPNVQARGLGKVLLDTLESDLRKRGINSYKVVAGEKLEAANKFYKKNGFVLFDKTEIHRGDISNVYLKEL